jgi:hypothetical protein
VPADTTIGLGNIEIPLVSREVLDGAPLCPMLATAAAAATAAIDAQ